MNNVKRANSTRTESFHVCDIGRAFTQLLAIAAMVFLAGALLSATSSAQSIPPPPATSSLIIKLSVGLSADEQAAVIAQCGGTETSTVPALRLHVVEVSADQRDQALANYQADPRVVRAELNKVRQSSAIPSDPFYSQQWALPRIGWDLVFGNSVPGGSVTVAVLDTGIEASHADLFGNVIPGTSILDGSDGLADPSGHGTMVAGTIAARTDTTPTEGIAGVAYAGVRLMPVTVLNADGLGQDSDVIAGVIWAVDNGANVIVMAFSNPGFSDSLQEAIDYAWSNNVVLVAAAGNDALGTPTYPAGDRGVIGVSATDENDQLASFSNYGPSVFLAAPGTNILTTDIGGTYLAINGTSSSAAIVAGAAAQLMAIDPTRSNGVIVGRLARNADPAGTQDQTGNGRINLARALTDTATDFIEPTGAAPFGPGGPFVGPYTAAAFTLTLTPNTGAPGTSVTATTGGGPFDKSATDIGIYWDGTLNTTNGTLVATCSVNSGGNLVAGCTFIVPSASAGTHTVVATQKSSTGKSVSATFTVTTASTSVTAAAASGVYGGTVNLSATLKSGTTAISGKTISFTLNGNGVGSATTNASGVATLSNVSLGSINAGNYITGVGGELHGRQRLLGKQRNGGADGGAGGEQHHGDLPGQRHVHQFGADAVLGDRQRRWLEPGTDCQLLQQCQRRNGYGERHIRRRHESQWKQRLQEFHDRASELDNGDRLSGERDVHRLDSNAVLRFGNRRRVNPDAYGDLFEQRQRGNGDRERDVRGRREPHGQHRQQDIHDRQGRELDIGKLEQEPGDRRR
jgi:subtilisin family serine protease